MRACVLIPTYDNPRTVRQVVVAARAFVVDVIVVDDGGGPEASAVLEQLASDGLARVQRLPRNQGKGAAVKAGFALAHSLGYTHALQLDADGQHDVRAIPRFLEVAQAQPGALVLARPVFGADAPWRRRIGRELTNFWVGIETQGRVVADAMVGFRMYPLTLALATETRADRMDFDIEIAVRMVWLGAPVINLPVSVRYLTREEGGVSHFRMWRDNVRISWLHTRLVIESLMRTPTTRLRWGRRLPEPV